MSKYIYGNVIQMLIITIIIIAQIIGYVGLETTIPVIGMATFISLYWNERNCRIESNKIYEEAIENIEKWVI